MILLEQTTYLFFSKGTLRLPKNPVLKVSDNPLSIPMWRRKDGLIGAEFISPHRR